MKNEEVLVSFQVEELEKRFEMGWGGKKKNFQYTSKFKQTSS